MKLKTFITLLISGLFLTMAVWNFNAEEFVEAIKHVNPVYFIPALLCYMAAFFFRTLRWKIMLRSIKDLTLKPLFSYIVIGFMANNLLPARLGEVVRAYVTGKREGMSRSSAFASVILERLFDGMTIVVILALLMFISGVDRPWLRYMAWVSTGLFGGVMGFLFALAYQRDRAIAFVEYFLKFLPKKIADKIMHITRRFVAGLSLLHHPKDFIVSLLMSFLVWGCEVMVYKVYLTAFGIDVPFEAALLALVVVNLSSMIPSSPGYIGVFQYACIKSLQVFGVGATTALTWSLAVHGTQVIPITILGLFLLSKMGMSMGEITRVELEDENGNGASKDAANGVSK